MKLNFVRINKAKGGTIKINRASKMSQKYIRRGGMLVKDMVLKEVDGADEYNQRGEMDRLRNSVKAMKIGSGKNRFINF